MIKEVSLEERKKKIGDLNQVNNDYSDQGSQACGC